MRQEKSRILILDDDDMSVIALSEYLKLKGYQVECVREISEETRSALAGDYALVIADPHMGGASPDDVFALLGGMQTGEGKPRLVVLTAYASSEIEARARILGASEVLHKPGSVRRIAEAALGRRSRWDQPDPVSPTEPGGVIEW